MSIVSIIQLLNETGLTIIIASVALAVSIYGRVQTDREIKNNAEATKTRLLHDMAKEERKIQFKLFETAREIKEKQKEIENSKGTRIPTNGKSSKDEDGLEELTEQRNILIENHLNFFDHLALLVNKGKVNEELAKEYFEDLVKDAHDNYKDRIYDDYPQFIRLYTRWIHPSDTEEQVTETDGLFSL